MTQEPSALSWYQLPCVHWHKADFANDGTFNFRNLHSVSSFDMQKQAVT